MRVTRVISAFIVLATAATATAQRFELLTGVNAGNYPAVGRPVFPAGGPPIPGTFHDGDRLAGTASDGPAIVFQGLGTPFYAPNEFGALSFMFKRGTVPAGPGTLIPLMGIDFIGGPRLDLDGDPDNGVRSLVPLDPANPVDPVELPGIGSYIELELDTAGGAVMLLTVDATGTNEGAPNVSAKIATVVVTIAGADLDGAPGPAINPVIDKRLGTLQAIAVPGVWRIDDLGFEFWQDSIDPGSSTYDTLGTFQYLGKFRGWVVQRDAATGQFPTLAGQGLGSTLWPLVSNQVGLVLNTANGLAGGSATIAAGSGADVYSVPNNGGLPLTDFGGDLGAYFDAVVVPLVPPHAFRFVYLESAGVGINNSFDPVFTDTIAYDVVLIGAGRCPGDLNGDGVVNQSDLGELLAAFGTQAGDPTFNPSADLNGDGVINQSDLGELLASFGTSCL